MGGHGADDKVDNQPTRGTGGHEKDKEVMQQQAGQEAREAMAQRGGGGSGGGCG